MVKNETKGEDMLIRIKRFTLNNKMILFTVILLFVMALTLGFVSFKLANDALNQKGETILKMGFNRQ